MACPPRWRCRRFIRDRTVVCVAGDGDFLMTGQDFATAVQYKLPVIVLVADNGIYGTIRMHQERDYPGRVIATDLRNPDFVAYALAFGGYGAVVEKSADFPAAFAAARASGKPSIIHLKIDPEAITPDNDALRRFGKSRSPRAVGRANLKSCRPALAHAAVNLHSLVPCPIAGPKMSSAGLPSASRRSSMRRNRLHRENGMGAVQIAPVAQRADIAAGTIYRYFPSKNDLVAEVIAVRRRARARRHAGGRRCRARARFRRLPPASPLSPRVPCNDRRLAWAVMAEPVDADIDALRLDFRRAIASELERRISTAIAGHHLPDQDARAAAPAIVGALLEGLIGPLAPPGSNAREAVQTITLFALRALGVVDARARGLVAQCVLP